MEASRSRKRWSYEEYAKLPRSGTTRYEVIAGELAVTPSPTSGHQQAVGNLVLIVGGFVRAHRLGRLYPGPLDILFGEGDYLQPDVVFVSADRAHLVSDRGIDGAPDLVAEVVSPATSHRDRGVKLERYRRFGVREYWIVDLAGRLIEVWRLGEGSDTPGVVHSGGAFTWSPVAAGPTLHVAVDDVLEGI